jgi:hypothetical protein
MGTKRDDPRAYWRKYYYDNLEQHREYQRKYRKKNKDKIRAWKKKYESRPERVEKHRERGKRYYKENTAKFKSKAHTRRLERKDLIDQITLHYKCKNIDCKWSGEYDTNFLDFHHLNSNTKIKEVAKMHSFSMFKIANEINKCVVLCRNCHALAHKGLITLDESMLCKVDETLRCKE